MNNKNGAQSVELQENDGEYNYEFDCSSDKNMNDTNIAKPKSNMIESLNTNNHCNNNMNSNEKSNIIDTNDTLNGNKCQSNNCNNKNTSQERTVLINKKIKKK